MCVCVCVCVARYKDETINFQLRNYSDVNSSYSENFTFGSKLVLESSELCVIV